MIKIIGKCALHVSQPVFLTGIRMLCAGLISYGIHRIWYGCSQFRLLTKKDWLTIAALAIFNVYITNAGEFWSLQYLSANKVSFIYNLSPFFVLIFSALLFAEKISIRKLIGMIIGFVFLLPILVTHDMAIDISYHFGYISIAEIIMLIASAATALGWVLMKHFIHKEIFTPYFLNGVSLTLGGLMCLAHAYVFEQRPLVLTDNIPEFLGYMGAMMFIQNIGAYNLHAYLLNYFTATLIALLSFVMPLMVAVISYVFLGEPITLKFLLCSIGVAFGLYIFYQEELLVN